MSGGEVVCSGWLRKSPPEKKLRRYAWKKRWFILRSGRMSGDPDVLEYYKNDHSKKPIRVINLSACEQVDAGLTFNKKELQDSYVFDIKTSDRIFYLVAETEEEMNKWVRSICQICGFNQSEENPESLRNLSSVSHGPRSSPAELSGSIHHMLRERKTSAPSHSSQPTLFTFESPSNHIHQPTLSASAPQDYLFLHQCMSRKTGSIRSASFSQATRSSFFMKSDTAVQKLSQGYGHCVNGAGAQVHGFYSLPKPIRHNSDLRDSAYDLPRSFGSDTPTKSSLSGLESDSEEVYTFKTPNNTLCKELSELSTGSYDIPTTPFSVYQIPRTFTLDKNHNALTLTSNDSLSAPPPRPPKPGQLEPKWGSPQQQPHNEESMDVVSATISRRNTLPAMENSTLHRASSCETYDCHQQGVENSGLSESVNNGFSSCLQTTSSVPQSDGAYYEDNYVPMNPGSSSPFNAEKMNDNTQNHYIPMSPGPHHFDFLGFSSATLPARKGSTASLCHRPTRVSEIQPPPVNRNLKPDRKSKPTPLDLRNTTVIDELPFRSPVTRSWSRPAHTLTSSSSQYCRPVSTQSITSTSSGDSEENYVAMQNPVSASPGASGTNSPTPKKSSGSVDYLALDFQPSSPGPHRKPSTSSVASDEKVDYVQVDKEKTQALQSTMQEWTDVRQSTETNKSGKQ
ncbi:GRB2-associated-binding protein 2 [Microcaecilia unicolor]|uniref:GRB2-associated-binding protein 2 n=1 Tax=Microcaecilia unicolor TaxID=1415580 RepID=A0A6P7XSA2_9AMPH|nr:GRB2-associated-binding protein 2 [Microcaecilia unicolor]